MENVEIAVAGVGAFVKGSVEVVVDTGWAAHHQPKEKQIQLEECVMWCRIHHRARCAWSVPRACVRADPRRWMEGVSRLY